MHRSKLPGTLSIHRSNLELLVYTEVNYLGLSVYTEVQSAVLNPDFLGDPILAFVSENSLQVFGKTQHCHQ